MKTEIESAIKHIAEKSKGDEIKPHEAMQLAQAALSFTQILAILDNLKK